MKSCIVSFARDGREKYAKAQARQIESLKATGSSIPLLAFSEYPDGCPSHLDVSHAFKTFCVREAISAGYDNVMWCDSTIVFRKNPSFLMDVIEVRGHLFFDNYPGCTQSHWTSKDCAEILEMTDEDFGVNQFAACVYGLNLTKPDSKKLYDMMLHHATDGRAMRHTSIGARPDFKDQRHDQTILTCLATRLGMEPLPMRPYLAYSKDEWVNEAYLENRGIT